MRGLYNIRQPIAHGGGIGRVRWRNTEESVQESIRNGFRIIEVDMLETSDGKYVGAHGWCTFRRLTGNACLKNEPLTYESAIKAEVCGCEHPLSFKFLRDVMEHNPDLILEVDKIQDYDYLLKALPYPGRLMVISYDGGVRAMRAGIRYPVFCVWVKENIDQAEMFGFPILGVNAALYADPENVIRFRKLHDAGVTMLVIDADICDDEAFIRDHIGKTCSAIYSERWVPERFPAQK